METPGTVPPPPHTAGTQERPGARGRLELGAKEMKEARGGLGDQTTENPRGPRAP